MMTATPAAQVVAAVTVAIALVTDLRRGKIPNAVTMPALLIGLAINVAGGGVEGLWFSLGGIGVAAAALVLSLVCSGAMGGGDIKLLAAVGALCGARFLLLSFCIATGIGGLMALVLAAQQGQLRAACSRVLLWSTVRVSTGESVPLIAREGSLNIPYGVAIAGGVAVCLALRLGGGM